MGVDLLNCLKEFYFTFIKFSLKNKGFVFYPEGCLHWSYLQQKKKQQKPSV